MIEDCLAGFLDVVGLTIMDLVGRHQADSEMMMVIIVPFEECPAEGLGVPDAAEALWKLRLVFQGLKMAFGEGIVVGRIGSAMKLGDTEIGEQKYGYLGFH